jgi:dTMP kinase
VSSDADAHGDGPSAANRLSSSDTGLFLVLEGGEGAGKTTQARLLARWMEARGIPHRLAREPGGTPVGERIRELLLEQRELAVPSETELLLMLAARAAFVRDVVRPSLARGEVMLADRFEYSTFVYQGMARGLGLERVRALNTFATGGLTPDLVIVLDVPEDEGRRRQRAEGKEEDRIEGAGAHFLQQVARGYRELSAEDPGAVLVAASGEPEAVHRSVLEVLVSRFPEPFGPSAG